MVEVYKGRSVMEEDVTDIASIVVQCRVNQMYEEALAEVQNPLWIPPGYLHWTGNPPLSAFAVMLVKIRLHMSEHNN